MSNNKGCDYRGYGQPYTNEEDTWLRENIDIYTYPELTRLFNEKFNHPVKTVSDHCIKVLGLHKQKNSGCFKIGESNCSITFPVGHESIRNNGEIYVKVSDNYIPGRTPTMSKNPNYRRKKDLIWEEKYGTIPNGYLIINLDMDKLNLSIENLYCIPRKIGLLMSKNGWWSKNADITLTAIKYCELWYAIKESEE